MLKNAIWIFILAIFILFAFLPSYTQMQDLRMRNTHYEQEVIRLKRERAQLLKEKKLLLEDPAYLEKVAREKMGLIKEGEVVYKITAPSKKEANPVNTVPARTNPAPSVRVIPFGKN